MSIKLKILISLIVVSMLVVCMAVFSHYELHRLSKPLTSDIPASLKELERSLELDALAKTMQYYDEVLTQSARNYAFTQDVRWMKRYKDTEPKLDDVIKKAIRIGENDPWQAKIFESIDSANLALVTMEYRAIKFTDEGVADSAVGILGSQEYWDLKKKYSEGLYQYLTQREDHLDKTTVAVRHAFENAERIFLETTQFLSAGSILAIIFIVFVSYLVVRFVTTPLSQLTHILRTKSFDVNKFKMSGQLKTSKDEIGVFYRGFLEMLEHRAAIEKKLFEDKEWFLTTLSSIGGAVISTDNEGRVVFMNPVAESLTGWKEPEAKGKLLKNIFRIVNEDTRKTVESPADKVLRLGTVIGLANHTILIAKDGREIPLDNSGAPIWNKNNEIIGVVLTFQDVTQRRLSERKLMESEEKSRLILETSGDAFIAMDSQGNILEWNKRAETIFGWKKNEITGCSLANLIIPEHMREAHKKGIAHYLKTGEGPVLNKTIEVTALNKKGWEFPVELTVWPIKVGQSLQFNAFISDISDRRKNEEELLQAYQEVKASHEDLKKTQQQLIQADRLSSIGQLAAGVAHEINNPIGFVASNVNTLDKYVMSIFQILRAVEALKTAVESDSDPEKIKELVREIKRVEESVNLSFISTDIDSLIRESKVGLERVKKIILDLKTFARPGAENNLDLEDLNLIIDGAINIVWNELKYKVELVKEFGSIPQVRCNAQQIGQVFINLLVNAAQAIQGSGKITLKSYIKDSSVYVEILDTGSGMSQNVMEHIFDPFFTTKDVGKGTGLGLSISHDIVKKHHGELRVSSIVGQGTMFILRLPLEGRGV